MANFEYYLVRVVYNLKADQWLDFVFLHEAIVCSWISSKYTPLQKKPNT